MSEQKSCETCGNMICIGPGNHLPYIGYCKSNDFLNWEPKKSCETCNLNGVFWCAKGANIITEEGGLFIVSCSNWEPRVVKSCGNCEKWEYSVQDGKNYYCTIRGHFNDIANGIWDDGCSNWVPYDSEPIKEVPAPETHEPHRCPTMPEFIRVEYNDSYYYEKFHNWEVIVDNIISLQGATHCPYCGHELGTKRET